MTNGKRQPRRKRAPRAQSARKASQESNSASKARGLIKRRLVALESRMVLLEREYMWLIDPSRVASDDVELSMKHWEGHSSSANAEEE